MVEGSLAISDSDNLTVRGRGILFNPHPSEGKGRSPLNIRTSSNVRLEGRVPAQADKETVHSRYKDCSTLF